MIELTDQQRSLVGWAVSILFNIGLLVIGAALLIQPARFQVEVAKSSTEIDFSAEPTPVPAPTPPDPTPPPAPVPPVAVVTPPTPAPSPEPSPFPSEEPVPAPEVMKSEIAPAPEPAAAPSPPSQVVPAKPHPPAKPMAPAKISPVREASNASKGAVDARPDELHNEPPEYPEDSRVAHEEGLVILRVEVSAAGEPASVSIQQSSGYIRLDQAARKAVQHWKFHPALTAGIPVSSEADVPVRFKLQ